MNVAVTHLDQMTQQNAALDEESAAAAGSLEEQGRRQAKAVSRFRLNSQATAGIGTAVPQLR